MQSIAHKPSQSEHEDIFQLLEEWEQRELSMPLPATLFGSIPTQPSYLHPADASQSAAASASLYGPLLESPDPENGIRQQSAPLDWSLEMHSEHLHRRARYPMAAPGPFLQAGSVRAQASTPPASAQPWKQESPATSQQQLVPQWLDNQGDRSSRVCSLAKLAFPSGPYT